MDPGNAFYEFFTRTTREIIAEIEADCNRFHLILVLLALHAPLANPRLA